MNSENARRSRRRVLQAVLGAMLLGYCGCGKTVIESEDSRKAIDALYTAVTSRRMELVDACEQRLKTLAASGEIPPSTMAQLGEIIARTRQQQWQPAAEHLNRLILRIAP